MSGDEDIKAFIKSIAQSEYQRGYHDAKGETIQTIKVPIVRLLEQAK